MIYYSDDTLTIRTLTEADAHAIAAGEQAQGYDTTPDRFLSRLREQEEGTCVAIAAEYNGQIAGYIHVYPDSKWGPLGGRGCPEIVDFGVLEKFRRQGVGARLMDAAEAVVRAGVSGGGTAQVLRSRPAAVRPPGLRARRQRRMVRG